MMGYSRLCLLMLLSSCTLAYEDNGNGDTGRCSLLSRLKTHKKYVYQYTAENSNGVVGSTNSRNGPKVSCQVEIEVPTVCGFIMHTKECTLHEPVYSLTPSSEAFRAAMEKNPLKFSVEYINGVQLFPEADEPVNILNIKQGIISTLMVPPIDHTQRLLLNTIHGQCWTDYVVNERRDIAVNVTVSRDLSQCDQFNSRELASSPIALLQKLHRPLSKMISSNQECQYQFDNKGKHVTFALCRENHIYLPFSNGENGLSSVVIQHLNFQSSKRTQNRVFDVDHNHAKPHSFEDPDDKASVQTKDEALSTFRDLNALGDTDQDQTRASLFHRLVSNLRGLRSETLSHTVTEMLETSAWLTWQALLQCGTSECTSAILQAIRTIDGVSLEVDALVYGLSLMKNPNAARVRDMLSVAQFKQSKAIMYALANTVNKFHDEEITPEVTAVSEFMKELLNDCSVETQDNSDSPSHQEDLIFLVLRVVGVMGRAMQAVNPGLISSVMKCAMRFDIPLSTQKSAIQAFRLMDINDEVRNVLKEVYQDAHNPVEKRIAAYLVLMKNPDQDVVTNIASSLEDMMDEQLWNFVVSHLKNIQDSTDPQMHQFREYIEVAFSNLQSETNSPFSGFSSNSRTDSLFGSVKSNIIFDATNTLPKEVMLETTLKVFDYSFDIFEVGIEGAGFEPTIDALFGDEGFFPSTISKVMYWATDKAQILREVLGRDRVKRQVPQSLLKDIVGGVQKIMNDILHYPAPEAIAYLRLMGNEMGYMKTSELKEMFSIFFMYFHVFARILPQQVLHTLMSRTDNEAFSHYIFSETSFSLPTSSGFPLKFSLAAVLAPGAKGGMKLSSNTGQVSFKPSVELEFITQMGVYAPDYAEARFEMHTNLYHKSSLTANVDIKRNQIRLSIAAPESNTRLFSVSNKLLSVSSGQTTTVPFLVVDKVDSTSCQPLLTGLNLCTIVSYPNSKSMDQAPFFPLTGETLAAVEIQPTGEVSEYSATITHETLREGKDGRQRVESLKLTLNAIGVDSAEATLSVKYNPSKLTLTTAVLIPDYDIEAVIKLAVSDTDADAEHGTTRGITLNVANKNIPQLMLAGRARLQQMNDAMLQLQMYIPSLNVNASVGAALRRNENVMYLQTIITLPETSFQQEAALRYDADKFEMELQSDLKSEIRKLIPNSEEYRRHLQHLIDNILDQRVAKTDMKLRHIVTKGIEAANIWLEKLTERIPGLANLGIKRSVPALTLPSVPEKLFLEYFNSFQYRFNKDKLAVSLPLPLGGKKSKELNIPSTLSVPLIDLPQIGLYIPPRNFPLPSFTIPPSLDLTVPLLGVLVASVKVNSNFYSWEGSITGGNNTVDVPNYLVQYKVTGESPFNILSYKVEGTGLISGQADDKLEFLATNSFSHSLIGTTIILSETLEVTNEINVRTDYKLQASSPLGLNATLHYSAHSTSSPEIEEVRGDGTLYGTLEIGSFFTSASYVNSYTVDMLRREGTGASSLKFNSPLIQFHNTITGMYFNSNFAIESKTDAQNDILKHEALVQYKDSHLTLKSAAVFKVMNKVLSSNFGLGVSSNSGIMRIESQADDGPVSSYSLITGLINSDGLEIISEGSLTFGTGRGLHKASVMVDRNGLLASGTNGIQSSFLTVENVFNGALDRNEAYVSSTTKANVDESHAELNINAKITASQASLQGSLEGQTYDSSTSSNLNIVLNRQALTFTSSIMGRTPQLETENKHTLTLTLWTLALHSKTSNFIGEEVFYKQDTKVDIRPFVMKLYVANQFKLYDISLSNEGRMRLEPIKLDLSGSAIGSYQEEHNFKNTFEVKYDNLAGMMKYSSFAQVVDVQLGHGCELEFAGLSSKSYCEAKINSEPLYLDGIVHIAALPFSLNIDAVVNGNGQINLYGKHSGQLYSKLLVKVEPLALVYSHDNQLSTTHLLANGESSTHLDNKFGGLLTPSDQALSWKIKSKLNDLAYNQEIITYNNPEKTGLEFSGAISTDLFSKIRENANSTPEIEDFSVTGFLKYDKLSDCHIIQMPFFDSFPVVFDQVKNSLLQTLETVQEHLHSLDINRMIEHFRVKVDQLPLQVREFMQSMDLENKVTEVKAKLDYLMDEFSVTLEDLELIMYNFKENVQNEVMSIATKIRDLILEVRDYVKSGNLSDTITDVVMTLGKTLSYFNEKYEIQETLRKVVFAIRDVIRLVDLQKLKGSTFTWLRFLDYRHKIMDNIREKLLELEQAIESFDVKTFFNDLSVYLVSIDMAKYVEQLSYTVPSAEIADVIESMNDVVVNWIDEYEVSDKLNAVYFYIRGLISRYNLSDKFKEILDQALVLTKEFKLEETVQAMVDSVKAIKFEQFYDKIEQFLYRLISQLRVTEFNQIIDEVNQQISSVLESLRAFDYNAFVDEANNKIAELTHYTNEQIKIYEIVQKIEAVREFAREIQNAIIKYLENLKKTKVADTLKKLKNVIDTTFLNDVKMKIQDILEDVRQRIIDMDIRGEIYIYLQRASESYNNIVAFFSVKVDQLIEQISSMFKENKIINQITRAVDDFMDALKKAEIKIPTFTVPLTDLVISAFTINFSNLQEINIPTEISVPQFTILGSFNIPPFTISFDEIRTKLVSIIENIKNYEVKTIDPEDIFGDLKVIYLPELWDVTFPEITLTEIKIPTFNIPKLNSVDFDITTLPPIPEMKFPEVPRDICIPVFGNLHGEFRLNSPIYTLVTTGNFENTTSSTKSPQFKVIISSYGKSPFESLEYTFEATAKLEAPRMRRLIFSEAVKASHMLFSIDHEGSFILTASTAEASAKTDVKARSQTYTADLGNYMSLTLNNGITAIMNTAYNDNLEIPSMDISSQTSMNQEVTAIMESGIISLTCETSGSGKWSIQENLEEGKHRSKLTFNINFSTAKLTFDGETDSNFFKTKQTLTVESVILSHIIVKARCETEAPLIKTSVIVLNGEGNIGEVKVALTARHDAELAGSMSGSISNTLELMVHPFEAVFGTMNKANAKIFFPLKLTGKVDLQNDYEVNLNSEKQSIGWFALARFNHYKYNHNFIAENNDMSIFFYSSANGEANLDFLTVPVSIPQMTVPYLEIRTPELRDVSLWENAGLETLLTTPQQSFDMNLKLHYYKNLDEHSFNLYLEPIYRAISDNLNVIQTKFKQGRDHIMIHLKNSYSQAKSQYIKHKMNTLTLPPRIFTLPGYKIPGLNIEVSAFRAEMPAFSYFVPKEVSTPSFKVPAVGFSVPSYTLVLPSLEFPVIYVPETLNEIQLPTFTLPTMQNRIKIPALGNTTCDFSFKSPVITVNANAALFNQSDIIGRLGGSSTSVFPIFNGKFDSTTSLTRKRGTKLASAVSLEHTNAEVNYECAISFAKTRIESSVGTTAKINLPFLILELSQELSGSTKSKPNIASKNKIEYLFNMPLIESLGNGNFEMSWALEALSPHVSLETSAQGKSDVTILDHYNFVGDLKNEATFYMNANGLRSTVTTVLNSNIDEQQTSTRSSNLFKHNLNNDFALDVALKRVLLRVDHMSNNNLDVASFSTNGEYVVKGEMDFVPLTSFKTVLSIDASQPSSLGHAGLFQTINLAVSSDKQAFTWSSREQLASLVHACDLQATNDQSEVHMDLTGSLEGHLAFLKSVTIPVYHRTLWDVLKFHQVSSMDDLQFLKITFSVVYVKNMEGQEYAIPFTLSENGVIFNIPEISIGWPSWVNVLRSIGNSDLQYDSDVTDYITLPNKFEVPAIIVPSTTLLLNPFTVDLQNIQIPWEITTTAFDIKLPHVPKLSLPSVRIETEFFQGKPSFISVKIPEHEIEVGPFTTPETIFNIDLPVFQIPEQRVEVPEIVLHLPTGVFIPDFGAFIATLKFSSPIYNMSTTAKVENKDSSLLTALNSVCSSTMGFLEYELSDSATLELVNGFFSLNEKGNFVHSDASVNWQHVFAQNLWVEHQTSDIRSPRHMLNVDITGPTFVDVNFRYSARKDGAIAAVSSPSTGLLGLSFQRRSPSQLYGKMFTRYLSSPDKENDAVSVKATLRNSQILNIQTQWDLEVLHHTIEGAKDRVPAIMDAMLKFINKYHTHHFGFDLNRGALKLKNTASNAIERAYHDTSMSLTSLLTSTQQLSDQGIDIYTRITDSLESVDVPEAMDRVHLAAGYVARQATDTAYKMLHTIKDFLRSVEVTVHYSGRRLSVLEILERTQISIISGVLWVVQRVDHLVENISLFIRQVEFTVPGSDVIVNGNNIIDDLKSSYGRVRYSSHRWLDLLYMAAKENLIYIRETLKDTIRYLIAENARVAPKVHDIHSNALQSLKENIGEVKTNIAEYKNLAKQSGQWLYNSMSTERISNDTVEVIGIIQSHLYGGLNKYLDLMSRASQSTAPYVTMRNTKLDVEIPLPFFWKAFGEWPAHIRR